MRVLVTGGGGFVGSALCARLRDRGWEVRSLARHRYPKLESLGIEQFTGDLGRAEDVETAVEDCRRVFHVGAKAGISQRPEVFERTNVDGTRHVIEACLRHGVEALIYTSTPSVISHWGGTEGGDESEPYPPVDQYEAHYPRTKAIAEHAVLAANSDRLATIAIRPHLIWGPEDTNLIPRILKRAKARRLRKIGSDDPIIDATYIENAVDAHMLASDRLIIGSPVSGRAYYITNGEPMPLWDLVNGILNAADVAPVHRSIPISLALTLGFCFEVAYRLAMTQAEPPITRFLARQLATPHWFDISAARCDLGYEPKVTTAEGLERLKVWFQTSNIQYG